MILQSLNQIQIFQKSQHRLNTNIVLHGRRQGLDTGNKLSVLFNHTLRFALDIDTQRIFRVVP